MSQKCKNCYYNSPEKCKAKTKEMCDVKYISKLESIISDIGVWMREHPIIVIIGFLFIAILSIPK